MATTRPAAPPTSREPRRRGGDSRRTWVAHLALLTVAIVAFALFAVRSGEAPPPVQTPVSKPSGVYTGNSPQEVAAFEAWRGRPVDRVMTFPYTGTWDGLTTLGGADVWRDSAYASRMLLSLSILPCEESPDSANYRDGAAGAYDERWRQVGQRLVDLGLDDAALRIGWEFNGGSGCHALKPGASQARPGASGANFAAYWRHLVTALRSVPGQHFRFVWCVAGGDQGFDATSAWPGREYVDYLGIDTYDFWYVGETDGVAHDAPDVTDEERWNHTVGGREGLNFWAHFADRHGQVPLAITEWGLWNSGTKYGGAGDSPDYIARMWRWIGTHDVAFDIYFNTDVSSERSRHVVGPGATAFPKAAARYRALFGAR